MNSWILIMTLMFNEGSVQQARSAVSVDSIDGFYSQKSCLAAANLWLKQMRDASDYDRFTARAVCVQK